MTGGKPQNKGPIGIYIFGLIFLFSPIGNIFFSLQSAQQTNVWEFIRSIYWFEWIWLSALALTGVCLLIRHRISWLLAMLSLTAIVLLNAYRFLVPPDGQQTYADLYMIFAVFASATTWLLAFYFRYPYIDRRSQWLVGPALRYDMRTAVQVVADDIYEGVTESISISGVRIILQRDIGGAPKKMRFVDVLFPAIYGIKVTCEVVEYTDNILRLRFKRLSRKNRGLLMAWLKSQEETYV